MQEMFDTQIFVIIYVNWEFLFFNLFKVFLFLVTNNLILSEIEKNIKLNMKLGLFLDTFFVISIYIYVWTETKLIIVIYVF